jgi:hypothetical protein
MVSLREHTNRQCSQCQNLSPDAGLSRARVAGSQETYTSDSTFPEASVSITADASQPAVGRTPTSSAFSEVQQHLFYTSSYKDIF